MNGFTSELMRAGLSRCELCGLGREYLLIGHSQDRVGLPLAAMQFGVDMQTQLALGEWMGASPIYSARMQREPVFGRS